jgi:hypothetical protein
MYKVTYPYDLHTPRTIFRYKDGVCEAWFYEKPSRDDMIDTWEIIYYADTPSQRFTKETLWTVEHV